MSGCASFVLLGVFRVASYVILMELFLKITHNLLSYRESSRSEKMSRAVVIPGKGIKTEELIHSAQIISALETLKKKVKHQKRTQLVSKNTKDPIWC